MDFVGAATPLNDAEIVREAQNLGVEPAAIWAVNEVESAGSGFLHDGRPKILFEAHYFHTLTHGRYDRQYPNISSPDWNRSLYGASGAHQYDRLAVAIGLNRTAALESASWGRFQIMGANYKACGFADIESYVQAFMDDEYNHLVAFGSFCRSSGIVGYLVQHDWSHFALRYNGTGNVAQYAQRLAEAYNDYPGIQPTPSPAPAPAPPVGPSVGTTRVLEFGDQGNDVKGLQAALNKIGYPLTIDGDFGQGTEAAVKAFQTQNGLKSDGKVGPITRQKLGL